MLDQALIEKTGRPQFLDDEAFRCLRSGDYRAFNELAKKRQVIDLSNCDLRTTDFRYVDLSNVVLRGSYLRDADLRGVDLYHLDLSGCSLHNAKISGTYFPPNITAEEIRLSHEFGTRLRALSN